MDEQLSIEVIYYYNIICSKTKEVNVLPNAGYGLVNVASNTAMRLDLIVLMYYVFIID